MNSRERNAQLLRVTVWMVAAAASVTLSSNVAPAAISFDPVSYLVDSSSLRPDYIRVADFDRDGRPDLVVSEENGNVYVYRNDGTPFDGAWPRTTIASLAAGPTDYMVFLDTADLDGDGWVDIVAAQSGGEVYGLRNDHTPFGAWSPVQVATAAMSPRVEIVDLDGDTWLDIVTLDNQYSGDTGYLRAFQNDGTPFDAAWSTSAVIASGFANSALDSGDLDNDGDPDLAMGMNEYYTFIAENDGTPWDGGWSAVNIGYHGFGMASGYVLRDFDGDGLLDLAMACAYQPASSQYVLHNDGTPFDDGWQAVDYGAAVASGIAAGDLDLDGDLDLISGDNCFRPSQCVAWENDGLPFDGNWPATDVSFAGQCPRDVALADLDGDGDLDVVQTHTPWPDPAGFVYVQRNLAIVPEPVIAAVADVPGDQGGKLLLEWSASDLDNPTVHRIGSYHVWRRIEAVSALARLAKGGVAFDATAAEVGAGTVRQRQVGPGITYWEYIAEIPARYADGYAYTVTTHADNHVEDFFIDAYEPELGTWWLSDVASGESIDNLAPAVPVSFAGTYAAGTTWLQWDPNAEPDLSHYAVYRAASAGGPWTLITTTVEPGYGDDGPAAQYYRLTALDVHNNESAFALLTPGETVDALVTVNFGLGPIKNPSRGDQLAVEFMLAQPGTARLELLDVAGRRVATRELAGLGIGRHHVDLAAGRRLAAGHYFVRLTQGAQVRVGRVTVVD